MKFILSVGLSIMAFALAAQVSTEFGEITTADMNYVPDFEPDAPAVVLFDKGDLRFISEIGWYKPRFTRTKRIKILTEEGLNQANIAIAFYFENMERFQRVEILEGNTYNLTSSGISKTPLNLKDVYEEKSSQFWSRKVFAMPDVKVGSVIEFKYNMYPMSAGDLPEWRFQDDIPTVHSESIWRMIPFFVYVELIQNIESFDLKTAEEDKVGVAREYGSQGMVTNKFYDMIHRAVMKNVPSLKDESFSSGREHIIMKQQFQLAEYYDPRTGRKEIQLTTWPKLVHELDKSEYFGKYLNKCEREASKIEGKPEFPGELDQLKVAQALIEFTKQTYSWNGTTGPRTVDITPKKLLKTGYGDVVELNLLLTAILRNAGIKATPVLMSTRRHGKVWTQYPMIDFFNYIVVLVETNRGIFLADGTDKDLPYNKLPIRCLNGKGLLLTENPGWVNLESPSVSLNKTAIQMNIDPQNALASAVVIKNLTEYDSYEYKARFQDDVSKIESYYTDHGFVNVSKGQSRFYDNPDMPYMIAFSGDSPIEIIDQKLLIKPFLNFPMDENTLTQDTRTYPVDLIYKQSDEFTSAIKIPEGYTATYIPESYIVDNELMNITYTATPSADYIDLSGKILFKQSMYLPENYTEIKGYFDDIVEKFNDAIVLEKAN
ncbi:MAG: DUF3857 domain-containing protein [Cyclobacteriaceae bacterium]